MASVKRIKASDGTGNASVATVQTLRAALATTITVDTVVGIYAGAEGFYATMGTPHTFTDPVTSEVITIISDATAVDFQGHIDTGHIIIDLIAPGYTDLGSKVGDIVIIRPTTQWSNNASDTLAVSLNDDGTIKNSAITYNPNIFDYVATGALLAGLGYGSTLTASLSAGTCYINGILQIIAAVATRGYTANKDTYVDALYSATGTATIVYTEVANNTISPALAANSIRLGIVVTGASSIAAATSINQGQETAVLPTVSSVAYCVTDGLGNLINPRDPTRSLIGYRQISTADFSTGNLTATQITGLSAPIIVPTGRRVTIEIVGSALYSGNASVQPRLGIWDGTVGSGAYVGAGIHGGTGSPTQVAGGVLARSITTLSAGAHTINASLKCSAAGTVTLENGAFSDTVTKEPAVLMIRLT